MRPFRKRDCGGRRNSGDKVLVGGKKVAKLLVEPVLYLVTAFGTNVLFALRPLSIYLLFLYWSENTSRSYPPWLLKSTLLLSYGSQYPMRMLSLSLDALGRYNLRIVQFCCMKIKTKVQSVNARAIIHISGVINQL